LTTMQEPMQEPERPSERVVELKPRDPTLFDPEALPFEREVLVMVGDQGQLVALIVDDKAYRCHDQQPVGGLRFQAWSRLPDSHLAEERLGGSASGSRSADADDHRWRAARAAETSYVAEATRSGRKSPSSPLTTTWIRARRAPGLKTSPGALTRLTCPKLPLS
jgi:hypothetical protein